MILLKILLGIALVIVAAVLFVLLAPVSVRFLMEDNKFTFSVKCWYLPIINSDGKGIAAWIYKIVKKIIAKRKAKKAAAQAAEEEQLENELAEDYYPPDTVDDTPIETTAEETAVVEEPVAEEPIPIEAAPEEELSEPEELDFADIPEEEAPEEPEKKKSGIKDKWYFKLAMKLVKKIIDNPLETLELVVDVFRSGFKPMCKIFRGIKISDLYIDFIYTEQDAYNCALNYAYFCTTFYSILGVASSIFNVKFKTVDILPGFGQNRSQWNFGARISLSLITPIIAGTWFLLSYTFRYLIPELFKAWRLKKSAERQK